MEQNSTPPAYPLQPAPNFLTLGFVECRALHLEDFVADDAARIYIAPTGALEVHTRRHLFQVTDWHFLEHTAIVDGSVPTVIHPGDEYSDPIVEQTPVRMALPRTAWESVTFAATLVLVGAQPTQLPPAPPAPGLDYPPAPAPVRAA